MKKKQLFIRICNMLISVSLLTTFPIKVTAETAKYTGLEPGTFMQRWLILGPIPVFQEEQQNRDSDAQKAAFEQDPLPVEEYDAVQKGNSVEISGETYPWHYLETANEIVSLGEKYGVVSFNMVYACADIHMAQAEKVLFSVGSDDGVKIWLNGELVHQKWIGRAVNRDEDLVSLNLREGNNRMILKIQNMEGPWGFCCRPLGDELYSERLLTAARQGNLDHIKVLIEQGADVNVKNEIGFTPLHIAWIYQQSDAAKCLIEHSADTTLKMPAPANSDHIPEFLDRLVPKLMATHKVPGVSIVGIKNRQIAWDRQYGVLRAGSEKRVDRDTVFEAGSMSKPVMAYLALKLVECGKLDLDRPLVEYLDKPYLGDEPLHKKITARMVLSHATGFPNWRPSGWINRDNGGPVPVNFEPGTQFGYSGEGFQYLQHVFEYITDTPYCEYVDKELFKPLGLTIGSHEWQDCYRGIGAAGHDAQGQPFKFRDLYDRAGAAFSLYCTPTEYASFVVEILKTDRSAAHSLSDRSLDLLFTRATKTDYKPTQRSGPIIDDPVWFGLGWLIDKTTDGDRIHHSGSTHTGFRCHCEFDRSRGTGIVIMTNAVGGGPLWQEVIAMVASP